MSRINTFKIDSDSEKEKSILSKNYKNKIICSTEKLKFKINLRILICDDELLIKKSLKKFFKKVSDLNNEYHFDIEEAENGFDCLNSIYKNAIQEKYFDLVIIDESMPYMNGSQVIHLLKRLINENNFKNLTIISYTSYNTKEKIEYIYSQGADYVMNKPISFDDFESLIIENFLKNLKENN